MNVAEICLWSFWPHRSVKGHGAQIQARFILPSRRQGVVVRSSWAAYIRGDECGQSSHSWPGRRNEERATDPLKLNTMKPSYMKNKCSKMPVTDFITHATHRDALPRRHEPNRAAVPVVLHHTALHSKVHAALDTTRDLAESAAANRVKSRHNPRHPHA